MPVSKFRLEIIGYPHPPIDAPRSTLVRVQFTSLPDPTTNPIELLNEELIEEDVFGIKEGTGFDFEDAMPSIVDGPSDMEQAPIYSHPIALCGYDGAGEEVKRTLGLVLPPTIGNTWRASAYVPFIIHKDWLPVLRRMIRKLNNIIEPPVDPLLDGSIIE